MSFPLQGPQFRFDLGICGCSGGRFPQHLQQCIGLGLRLFDAGQGLVKLRTGGAFVEALQTAGERAAGCRRG